MKNKREPLDRFLALIKINDAGCWIWTGAKRTGYGVFKAIHGENLRHAHRWAYTNFKGPIPVGLQIDHLCRVKACVNPEHLEAVTGTENMRRMQKFKVIKKLTHCRKGHEFTPDNIVKVGKSRTCRICRNTRIRRYRKQGRDL